MSLTIDPSAEDISENEMSSATVLRGTIRAAEGLAVWGPDADESDPVWGNLLGIGNEGDVVSTYSSALREVGSDFFTGFYLKDGEVDLTIPDSTQRAIYDYMDEHGIVGSVSAYNYRTGDIACLASTTDSNALSGCFECIEPGSTMKLVTMLLLVEQGVQPEALSYTCDGDYTLANGEVITCSGTTGNIAHGTVNGASALGQSCNCWFAWAAESYLNTEAAAATLRELGFDVAEESSDPQYAGTTLSLGLLTLEASRLQLGTSVDSRTAWDLVGLEHNLACPVQMMEYVALLASGGDAVMPRLEQDEALQYSDFGQTHREGLQEVFRIWQKGYQDEKDGHYSTCSDLISAAKTGTVTWENHRHRLMAFCCQDESIAGYIYIQNYDEAGVDLGEFASFAAETIAEGTGKA